MDLVSLLISLVSGAVGGNLAGAAMKDKSLGTLGNSIAGIVGGGVGGFILKAVGLYMQSGGSLDPGAIIGNIAGGGIGGAVLLVIVALIKGGTARAS
jgi:uncharacterized membrane protein YeaQ/YmgE (transglycosylase-associated protein family)